MDGWHTALWFGRATSADEFEQIFRLNHRSFAEEIPQHPRREDGRLVDRFHDENDYFICKNGGAVIGMIALRTRRPFSLDAKLPDLDRYLPRGRSVCEIRLLAISPEYRHSRVLPGLARELARCCRERGHDYAVISGTTRQIKLYAHLGFTPFGPLTGKPGAFYQPMAITLERFCERVAWLAQEDAPRVQCLLPGPAQLHPAVAAAAGVAPKPHRSRAVAAIMADCRRRLCDLSGAEEVQILVGSGTLANDAIAQQLRLVGGRGLVLANGEFGERLVDHACRAGLDCAIHRARRGTAFDFDALAAELSRLGRLRWMWMAHCETSTGVLNDLAAFSALARTAGAEAAVDCVSSLGNVALDLAPFAFASGVSGKGLAALPGLALVFHRRDALRSGTRVPRYLDLCLYAENASIPFTHSSNLLEALAAALQRFDAANFARRAAIARAVRAAAAAHGLAVVGDESAAAPFVITIALPRHTTAAAVGEALLARGYHIAFESRYLAQRNWVQLAWMGAVDAADVVAAVAAMAEVCGSEPRQSASAAATSRACSALWRRSRPVAAAAPSGLPT